MKRRIAKVATCSVNLWSLDFDEKLRRIKHSFHLVRKSGAKFQVGLELEVTGHRCEDQSLERDTTLRS